MSKCPNCGSQIEISITSDEKQWKCDGCGKKCTGESIQEDGEQYDFCSIECRRRWERRRGG